ncbi:hypothetical protein BV25DRAFT_1917695 [Artomyces pyxidatus]|uniref:Uncharacterized protein n=1 Tax=Artomyces pyxidatus TaxID=48021 RepID=A0ACB8SVJ6_9AGAM|nr:hypothetical protein BV25DRAFT_1917695 [Artomyces pyxidatus]
MADSSDGLRALSLLSVAVSNRPPYLPALFRVDGDHPLRRDVRVLTSTSGVPDRCFVYCEDTGDARRTLEAESLGAIEIGSPAYLGESTLLSRTLAANNRFPGFLELQPGDGVFMRPRGGPLDGSADVLQCVVLETNALNRCAIRAAGTRATCDGLLNKSTVASGKED